MPGDLEQARSVLRHAQHAPRSLGSGRLICIDGPAGSGKTTLAAEIARLTEVRVIHLDDLYEGWSGLAGVGADIVRLLTPLSRDQPGRYRRYDWTAGQFDGECEVEPGPLLVLEGVGSGGRAWSSLITTLAWVEAPPEIRLARGLARDGEAVRERWLQWMADEAALFEDQRTRCRADLLLRSAV